MAKKNWDDLSWREQKILQSEKLNKFLKHQARYAPFYRENLEWEKAFAKYKSKPITTDSIQDFPFTTKNDYLPTPDNPAKSKDFILQPTPELIKKYATKSDLIKLLGKKLIFGADRVKADLRKEYAPIEAFFTTGRSADSVAFTLSAYDMDILKTSGKRIVEVLGLNPETDKGFNLFPYVPHLGFWQAYYAVTESGILTVNSGGGKCLGTEKIINGISKLKPAVVFGVPGYTYHILRQVQERNLDWSFIKTVAMGGEKVSMSLKAKIKAILGDHVNVVSVLGMTESKHCWAECPSQDGRSYGFHTYPDLEFFEIVNPETGERVDPGATGELVYTSLDARGSIMLRYRTGDLVQGGMDYYECPNCGRSVPRISTNLGRVSNIVEGHFPKIKGAFVNFNLISDTISDIDEIEEWQIILGKQNNDPDAMDEMNLALSLKNGSDPDKISDKVKIKVSKVSEVGFNSISLHSTEEMLVKVGMETQTKETRIVDTRKNLK